MTCRECYYLTECRYGFSKGRKCRNGCIRIKNQKKAELKRRYEEMEEDRINSLIEEANRQEERGEVPPITDLDVELALEEFHKYYLPTTKEELEDIDDDF